MNKRKKRMIKMIKEDIIGTIKNKKNKSLFKYGGIRSRSVGVRHLTGSINKMSMFDGILQNRRI